MKQSGLIIFLCFCISFNGFALEFNVQNYLGVNCLKYETVAGETLFTVANKFYVRPSTLAVVNGLDNVSVLNKGTILYVPLTETNFFKTKGLKNAKFSFRPVYHQVVNGQNLEDVASLFVINISDLKQWNTIEPVGLPNGNKLIVGWVKYQENAINETPEFIAAEKQGFDNNLVLSQSEIGKTEKYKPQPQRIFPDYSIPSTAIPSTDAKKLARRNERAARRMKLSKFEPKRSQESDVASSDDKKVETPAPQNASEETVTKMKTSSANEITSKEKAFISKDIPVENKKVKKTRSFSLRKITRNSYVREKAKAKSKKQNDRIGHSIEKKVETKLEAQTKPKTVVKSKEAIKKSEAKVEGVEKVGKRKDPPKPLYVQNKLQRLSLLKSMKGRASFFYSGNAGAKFYVFTNLANKGGVIKITNVSNGKYILAEVIGALPEIDRKRGYIVKLSDNSKLILRAKGNSFTTKVNY